MSLGNELITLEKANLLYKDLRERSAPIIFNNAVGNPVAFSDGADGLPIQGLKANLLPFQSGSGNASPQNVRPFVAWDGIQVERCGKNLLSEFILASAPYGTFDGFGFKHKLDIKVKPNTNYTLSSDSIGALNVLYFNGTNSGSVGVNAANPRTQNSGDTGILSILLYDRENIADYENLLIKIQLEEGSVATDYEPYTVMGNSIEFPSSVYGCKLDLITGELWATWKRELLNDVDAWIQGNEYISYSNHSFSDRKTGSSWIGLCSALQIKSGIPSGTPFARWGGADAYNFIISSNGSDLDLAGVKSLAQSGDLEIAYELADPILIGTVTPFKMKSLYGVNTIWTNGNGDLEVEYRADTGLFLKRNTVKDVQVDGSSILQDGVANVPIATGAKLGVGKFSGNDYGIGITAAGIVYGVPPTEAQMKAGTNAYKPITANRQHISVFYGLSKAAGVDMAQSSNPVGTYTSAAKHAIQNMIGLSGILGDYESTGTASKAYAIGDTFIFEGVRYRATAAIALNDAISPGTNCEPTPIDGHYVRDTDYATSQKAGLVKNGSGIALESSTGKIYLDNASEAQIKGGVATNIALPPFRQHISVFFGLSKAAGIDLANVSDVVVGTYPQASQAAIQTMLGVPSTSDLPIFATKAETEEIISEWNGDIIPSAQGVSF